MRILVVSDIHANRAALEAVAREPHDAVICLGDIVGYGPEPRFCVNWVRDNSGWTVQGNHDLANADGVSPRCRPNFAWLAEAVSAATREQLDDADRAFLRGLPRWVIREIDGLRIAMFHARPSDPLYGYLPKDPMLWRRELERADADLVLVGHTHEPFMMPIGRCLLLNPGSVGQPKHGDPRAAYAVVVDGRPELRRVEYSVMETTTALSRSAIDPLAVEVLSAVLRTGDVARAAEHGLGSGQRGRDARR